MYIYLNKYTFCHFLYFFLYLFDLKNDTLRKVSSYIFYLYNEKNYYI